MKRILLLHGWNYRNYTSQTKEQDAWHNRTKLVNELEKNYKVYKINFPGFCGEKEPKQAWTLTDYAKYVHTYLEETNLKVDYILGYSFGGAVAITYNRLYDNNQKLILISPAIIRNFKKSNNFIKTPKVLNPLRNKIRDFYLIHKVKTNEMVYGTKFLRATYQNIVRVELLDEVEKIDKTRLKIIYGEKDTMVNPNRVLDNINKEYKDRIFLIKDGGHDIANTHVKEIMEIIGK